MNIYSLLNAKASTVFAICLSCVVALIFVFAVIMLWWTEIRKKTFKDFGRSIGRFFKSVGDKLSPNKPVKTVYTDKSRNYSGTEFLPVPAKAPTKEYTYEFVGWDKNYTNANGNTVAKPIYIQKVNTVRVNIYDDDCETLLKSAVIEYGAGVDVTDLHPTKPESKEFTYDFVGWDKDTKNFYKNENVYAVYKAHPKMFTYTFYNDDGRTIISQTNAIYGTPILAPEPPKKDDLNVEFAYYRGYEEGMILDRNISFVAVYTNTANGMTPPRPELDPSLKRQSLASFESDRVEVFGAGAKSLSKPKQKEKKVEELDEFIQPTSEEPVFDSTPEQNIQMASENEPSETGLPVINLAGSNNVETPSSKPEINFNSDSVLEERVHKRRRVRKLEIKNEIKNLDNLNSNIRILGPKRPQ